MPKIYLIGLDLLIDDNEKIKILEIQDLHRSNLQRAEELTGLKPQERLITSIKKTYPDLKIKQITAETIDQFARIASIAKSNDTIPNQGLEAIFGMKWIFYGICNENPRLTSFIPETHIETLETVDTTFDLRNLHEHLFLIKPSHMARGEGISLLPQLDSGASLKAHIVKQDFLKHHNSDFSPHEAFIIQKYCYSGPQSKPISKPVIRVYAAVILEGSNLKISIDSKAAYQHIRIMQSENDFTLENNNHVPCDIEHLKGQIQHFLKSFFQEMLGGQSKLNFRYWEILAKKYIRHADQLNKAQRTRLIGHFALALLQEQRFTQNKLSHYQCFLLEAFLERFQKEDAAHNIENKLIHFLLNAFLMVAQQNLQPYIDDIRYPLHSVMDILHRLLEKTDLMTAMQMKQFTQHKPIKSISPRLFDKTGSFMDFCTKEDLEALSKTSKTHLSLVAGYARR